MKKNYILICLLLIASISFAQKSKPSPFIDITPKDLMYNMDKNEIISPSDFIGKKKLKNNSKAFLDTLAYEDFDGGLNGWTVTDINNNGNIWEWNTSYRTGNASGAIRAIQSTTGSNGFLSLPSDFYNSPRPNPPVQMETFVTSPAIALSSTAESVYLEFQQYFARCCFFAPMHFLEVSADSLTWDTIAGVEEDVPVNFVNAAANNITPSRFNISEVAGGQDTIYIRFRASRNIVYWWMIDDVTLLEGPKHDLELSQAKILFNTDSFGITPAYRQIPYDLFSPAAFQAVIENQGSDSARNTSLTTDIRRIRDLNGNVVNNFVAAGSESVGTIDPFPAGFRITEDDRFSPLENGVFRVAYGIETDSVDQVPGSETDTLFFITTDSVYASDDGGFGIATGISPAQISQGTSVGGYDGDAAGTMYIIESRTQGNKVIPTSITYYVTNDPVNIGISISPSIWVFNEDTASIIDAWLPEDFNNNSGKGLVQFGPIYQVTASDTNSFLTLPLDTAGFAGLDSGQYMVGWEVISGSSVNQDVYFEVSNDLSTAARQPTFTSLLYHANTTPKNIIWNSPTTQFQPVIRLNISTLPVQTSINALNNSKSQIFDVAPNPSTGELKINLMVENQSTYSLNVRNLLGQTVYSDQITVKGTLTERLDLSHLDKGLYFVSLENAVERLQKKIILQ